jgi:F-type H+-transporting ATPase subunit b
VVDLATILFAAEAADAVEEEISNPILPVANEIFWAAVTFFTLWALMKYVLLPPLLRTMAARDEKVRQDLEAAEQARRAREEALAEYEAALAGARVEAVRAIEDARAGADGRRKAALAEAEDEVAAAKARTAQEIADAKAAARAQLQGSIASVAIGAAEAVVQKPLDRDAETQVIEDYVNRAGSQS